jgi:CDP-diacylglycerol--serine O-phosphatidyltransferase
MHHGKALIIKLRYTIPNGVTGLSLMLGLSSIIMTQYGELEFAAWLIVWCGLLDTLDGVAARLLKATSDFGAEFDSMADVISFGVAPAVLTLNAGVQVGGIEYGTEAFLILMITCGIFALAGAMRLARFNIDNDKPPPGWFTGVPITACGGGVLASIVLVLIYHNNLASSLRLDLYLPLLLILLSVLMISRLRFPKATVRDNQLINAFQVVNIILIFYCGITRSYPEYLLGISLVLVIGGIIAGHVSRRRQRQAESE